MDLFSSVIFSWFHAQTDSQCGETEDQTEGDLDKQAKVVVQPVTEGEMTGSYTVVVNQNFIADDNVKTKQHVFTHTSMFLLNLYMSELLWASIKFCIYYMKLCRNAFVQ